MWVIQSKGLEVRCIRAMHVKFKEKLKSLVKNFCEIYKDHQNKMVYLFGEPHGTNKQPNSKPLYNQLQDLFSKSGWLATIMVEPYDKADLHKERYVYMNDILEEGEEKQWTPFLRMNADECEDAIIAMQKTRVTIDYKKDKGDEKKPEHFPQEHAPHYTDALDYYIKQKFGTWGEIGDMDVSGSAGTI